MDIVNRRNAILGWTVWTISKKAAKRKAKQAISLEDEDGNGRPGKRVAVLSGLAATGGAVLVWRRRRGGDEET
jgi:hypothetical protein